MSAANPPTATNPPEDDQEQQLIDASNKYAQELRRTITARVVKDDGSLGEPGALPYDQLIKAYLNQPLESE